MSDTVLIFPHHLFKDHPALDSNRNVFIFEDSLFFRDAQYPINIHKQKLVFHRASMQFYKEYLLSMEYQVKYIEHIKKQDQDKKLGSYKHFENILEEMGIETLHLANPVDWAIEKRLDYISTHSNIELTFYQSPQFLTSKEYLEKYFSKKKGYLQTSFYIEQRKKLDILIDNGKPKGGKWTYDTQNRKKLPKDIEIPEIPQFKENKYIKEAKDYINTRFSDNPGKIEQFFYPVTHDDAWEWFQVFLEERFKNFGPYEDAVKRGQSLLFHSLLSPLLNSGLITPEIVINEVQTYAQSDKIPLNSLEGFIRQIIGWREFIRAVYELEGVRERTSNHFNHTNTMPNSFYNATTGVLPIDEIIERLLRTGYLHHIERLMLLANFMTLCEIDPNEIYRWFMELFIDAYDWVMVPNVYGMSTYADGGLITTKPYVSSSNYVRKMSDYPKGEWCDIWDALYWSFIDKNRETFSKNPRMSLMVNILNKKDKKNMEVLMKTAQEYLKTLHGSYNHLS
jgi:deoxyribodipyrimidine photolyase-related protein